MPVAPEEVVEPPGSEPARHGIVTVARNLGRLREGDGRWEAGFVFQPENCIASEVWVPCGGSDQVILEVLVDADAGSWAVSYDGGPETLIAFNATADEVAAAIAATFLIPLSAVSVRGGPGGPNAAPTVPKPGAVGPYFIVIDVVAGFDPSVAVISDSTADPLSGGDGIAIEPVQVPGMFGPPDVKKDYDGDQGPIRVHRQ